MSSIQSISDPSGVLQSFSEISLRIHCCRYWKLSVWNLHNMISPFWRLYHNTVEGACIIFNNKRLELTADRVFLIPPNTSYSTEFLKSFTPSVKNQLEGSRITKSDEISNFRQLRMFDHFFVHFNLGLQYDNVKSAIHYFKTDLQTLSRLKEIKSYLREEYRQINIDQTSNLHALILNYIAMIPSDNWQYENYDKRVIRIVNYIDQNFHLGISNKDLADLVAMSPNALLRIFKQHIGIGLHTFLQKRRIEESILYMHHTDKSIDEIASDCGFCDRYHLSKEFKKQMKISPALYRKQLTMK